ncbi:hypothetical protein MSAN_01841300 [Mycena sanguinolenta]|uniref:Uncharacterized protein n=1 Tax=Mycena sanguinolenta TaxID=230812 RepID=A0A8H6XTR4_9AGAR|nr:hypothetical protein MSAN_01841300 [Mycena sanguinolenta]
MSALWRSRFLWLLIPCIVGLLVFFSFQTHTDDSIVLDQPFAVASPSAPVAPNATELDGSSLPKILLVTAFFPLSKSKHTMADYEWWLSQFLQHITTDIYFFAPPEMESMIRKCRGDLPITVNTTYSSPFGIAPLNMYQDHYQKMHQQDRERFRHSPELYAVWNAKPFFLDEGVRNLLRVGQAYDYAFWNDAGSFRSTHKYTQWPDPRRVQELWQEGSTLSGMNTADLLFFPIAGVPHPTMRYWVQDHGPVDTEFSEGADLFSKFTQSIYSLAGSFFGGSPSTVAWWRYTFYAYHDHYLNLDLFVGKDQTLINAIFLLFPSRVIAVWIDDPDAPAHKGILPVVDDSSLGNCGGDWFYYQFWLATPSERQSMREIWASNARWSWAWWRERQECRVTRISSIKDLLKRRFGDDWEPPLHTIDA